MSAAIVPGQQHAQRPAPVDAEPGAGLVAVLEVLDRWSALADDAESLVRSVEQVVGLRRGEVQLLRAVAAGEGTALDVDGVVHRGLLASTDGRLALTDDGVATLAQVEAVQLRLLAAALEALGEQGVGRVRALLDDVEPALRSVAGLARGDP